MNSGGAEDVAKGLQHLVGRSLVLKSINFLLGSLLLQLIPLDYYGLHTVNLFFFVVVTGWARGECFRKVLLRLPPGSATSDVANRNVQRISFRSTCAITAVALLIWICKKPGLILQSSAAVQRAYCWTVVMHSLASLLTSIADGPVLAMNYRGLYEARARQDNVSAMAYTMAYTVPMLMAVSSNCSHALPFLTVLLSGVSQTVYSLSMLELARRALPWKDFVQSVTMGFTKIELDAGGGVLGKTESAMLWTEVESSVQKLILSESDKLVLMRYVSDETKGAIAMVTNLGGILIRLFFAPQEEMLCVYYSADHVREESRFPKKPSALYEYLSVFRMIAGMQLGIGIISCILGPRVATCILRAAYGARGLSLVPLFSTYCKIVTVMSFVGVMEGFLNAASSSKWIRGHQRFNRWVWLCVVVGVVLRMEVFPSSMSQDWRVWAWAVGLTFAGRLVTPLLLMRQLCKHAELPAVKLLQTFVSAQFSVLVAFAIVGRLLLLILPTRLAPLEIQVPSLLMKRLQPTECLYVGSIGLIGLLLLRHSTRQRSFTQTKIF